MAKKKRTTVWTWIIMLFVAAGIVGGYFMLIHQRNANMQPDVVRTELDKLLEKDLSASYPATAREVVKLYSRMMKCLYQQEMNQEQLEGMASQLRMLFDEEFLEANPWDDYLLELQEEIKESKENKRTISSYQVEKASSVINWSDEDKDYARMIAYYLQKEGTQSLRIYEEFVLRKDMDGDWKILGWRLTDGMDMDKD